MTEMQNDECRMQNKEGNTPSRCLRYAEDPDIRSVIIFGFHSAFCIHHSAFILSDPCIPHIFTNPRRKVADRKTMDVTSISGASAFQQQKVANNVSTTVAAKVANTQRAQGADVLKLLEASTVPQSSGGSKGLDIRA